MKYQTVHKHHKMIAVFMLIPLLLIVLAACGGGRGDDDDSDDGAVIEAQADSGQPRTQGGDQAASFSGPTTAAESSAQESEIAEGDVSGSVSNLVSSQTPFDRLVIRTAQITLTVSDVDQAAVWLRGVAISRTGFVFASNTYIEDGREFAQITLKVPADQFDATINEIRESSFVQQIDREETTSQDVSAEFIDNESRLAALEETQRRFLELLSEADEVNEILRIESELTNIRTQIETIKGRQSYLSEMTAFSTISVTLHLPIEENTPEKPDEDDGFFARIVGDSWTRAEGVIEGLLAVAITSGIIALALAPFALLLYVIYRLVRSRVERTGTAAIVETHSSSDAAS